MSVLFTLKNLLQVTYISVYSLIYFIYFSVRVSSFLYVQCAIVLQAIFRDVHKSFKTSFLQCLKFNVTIFLY
jgi:hypothetical protein